jgi:hypothetical protein
MPWGTGAFMRVLVMHISREHTMSQTIYQLASSHFSVYQLSQHNYSAHEALSRSCIVSHLFYVMLFYIVLNHIFIEAAQRTHHQDRYPAR